MAEKDKIIKSGQFTLGRLFFLAAIGGLIVAMVAIGGLALSIGYWVLTLAICVLLYLIAIDYGIKMDKIDVTSPAQVTAAASGVPAAVSETPRATSEARVKRKANRPAKRRR